MNWKSTNAQGTLEFALQVMQVYEAAMLSLREARETGSQWLPVSS